MACLLLERFGRDAGQSRAEVSVGSNDLNRGNNVLWHGVPGDRNFDAACGRHCVRRRRKIFPPPYLSRARPAQ